MNIEENTRSFFFINHNHVHITENICQLQWSDSQKINRLFRLKQFRKNKRDRKLISLYFKVHFY